MMYVITLGLTTREDGCTRSERVGCDRQMGEGVGIKRRSALGNQEVGMVPKMRRRDSKLFFSSKWC